MKQLFTLFIFVLFSSYLAMAQDMESASESQSTNLSTIENQVSFQESLNPRKLDYNLEPISDGHFKLIFINQPSEYVHIKIYDIIGNLILSDESKYSLSNEIEYNLNELNTKIFVVKVETEEGNLTKKVNF